MEENNNKQENIEKKQKKVKVPLIFIIICSVLIGVIIGINITNVVIENKECNENDNYIYETPKNEECNDISSNNNYTYETPDDYIHNSNSESWDNLSPDIFMNNKSYDAKPIIYLYPIEESNVSVKLGYPNEITCSYPKYTTGWEVLAKPNGDLIDLTTGRNLYSLYYESKDVVDFKIEKEGFVVKSENTAKFLEEKLSILGLTEREAEEFIVYWLPKLEANKYNYIRFATQNEIEENMPLEISPKPDTLIRVLMEYKGLEEPIDVEEQKLDSVERNGFVAVEWGGTELK